jgi:hypothetical protein
MARSFLAHYALFSHSSYYGFGCVMAIVYGLTTLSPIAFYLIPVQLPFYLDGLVKATPSQSGLAIALCTLFSAIAILPLD